MNWDIEFNEGATWPVIFELPEDFDFSDYEASLLVRRDVGKPVILEFSTVEGTIERQDSSLLIRILPSQSLGKVGEYKYQLKLSNGTEDVIKFPDEHPGKLTIHPSINP